MYNTSLSNIVLCFAWSQVQFSLLLEGEMPSFENLNDSEEYIAQAEDRRAEHRPPRRKLGNNGAGIGKKEKKTFFKKV